MLKLLIWELLKLYKKPVIHHLSDYLYIVLNVASLVVLIIANYIYQIGSYKYMAALLTSSAILLAMALIIKAIVSYRNRPSAQQKEDDLMAVVIDLVPFVVRALPVGLVTLFVWSVSKQVKDKYLGELRQSMKK